MKVKFVTPVEIEVYTSYDEFFDEVESETEVFNVGDTVEFDIIDHPIRHDGTECKDIINVQFGDGSVAFGVSCEWFELTN